MVLALEVAVQDAAGVRIARKIGAERVELTQGLALGGLTPSMATIETALEAAGADGPEIHVLVRPRAGDFVYTPEEIDTTARDIRRAVEAGVHGVVIGAVTAGRVLDIPALTTLRDAAGDASVTLHRAIDSTRDKIAALEAVRALRFRRVLTSGGASSALEGVGMLREMVAASGGAIQIMAGGGIDAHSAPVVAEAGVHAVHFSAKRTVTTTGGVKLGSAADDGGGYEVTDLALAQAIASAVGRS